MLRDGFACFQAKYKVSFWRKHGRYNGFVHRYPLVVCHSISLLFLLGLLDSSRCALHNFSHRSTLVCNSCLTNVPCETTFLATDTKHTHSTYHDPIETTANVAIAQCPASNTPADNPLMTPIPAPLAIPLINAPRAHGISLIFLTLFVLYYSFFANAVRP